ncbi:TPA: acylneuraminate cytidylyltransferase [Candidatus Latescibacteria bacterium]|nr:acylneuraminate cytidylyltransferase [Candidatus Latescibacterota bacterium]
MNPVIVIQARTQSSRLPNKIFQTIGDVPILSWVARRAARANAVDGIIIATSTSPHDDSIENHAVESGWTCYRGSEHDVLDRFVGAAREASAEAVVRVTADCPFIDPGVIGGLITHYQENDLDYAGCVHVRSFPRGLDAEIMRLSALERVLASDTQPRHREHVTPYFYEHPHLFRIAPYVADGRWLRPDVRLCLDDQMDLQLLREAHALLPDATPESFSTLELLETLDRNTELLERMRAGEHRHHAKNHAEGIHHTLATAAA